jgi:hypothetical protein
MIASKVSGSATWHPAMAHAVLASSCGRKVSMRRRVAMPSAWYSLPTMVGASNLYLRQEGDRGCVGTGSAAAVGGGGGTHLEVAKLHAILASS